MYDGLGLPAASSLSCLEPEAMAVSPFPREGGREWRFALSGTKGVAFTRLAFVYTMYCVCMYRKRAK
jgi:hypothetical protein